MLRQSRLREQKLLVIRLELIPVRVPRWSRRSRVMFLVSQTPFMLLQKLKRLFRFGPWCRRIFKLLLLLILIAISLTFMVKPIVLKSRLVTVLFSVLMFKQQLMVMIFVLFVPFRVRLILFIPPSR